MATRTWLAVAALLVLAASSARAETITIVGDPWCPYNCEAGGDRPGFAIEIAKEIFAAVGIDVRYQNVDWENAIKDTRTGKYTAIVGATREDAPDFVFPTQEIGKSVNAVVVRAADTWKYEGPQSFSARRVGTIKDYAYGTELDGWFKEHPPAFVAEGDDPKDLMMKKLLAKEIDTFIEDRAVMAYYVRQKGVTNVITVAGMVGKAMPVYIAFSPANQKSATYARQFSEGIEKLGKSGKLKEIYARYGYSR
jgi:polar amino acid transport system substrate-binding protein